VVPLFSADLLSFFSPLFGWLAALFRLRLACFTLLVRACIYGLQD